MGSFTIAVPLHIVGQIFVVTNMTNVLQDE